MGDQTVTGHPLAIFEHTEGLTPDGHRPRLCIAEIIKNSIEDARVICARHIQVKDLERFQILG